MPETHAVGPASGAQRGIWGQVRRLNLTTGVTHAGAGAESGGDPKGDGRGVAVWKKQLVLYAGTELVCYKFQQNL